MSFSNEIIKHSLLFFSNNNVALGFHASSRKYRSSKKPLTTNPAIHLTIQHLRMNHLAAVFVSHRPVSFSLKHDSWPLVRDPGQRNPSVGYPFLDALFSQDPLLLGMQRPDIAVDLLRNGLGYLQREPELGAEVLVERLTQPGYVNSLDLFSLLPFS